MFFLSFFASFPFKFFSSLLVYPARDILDEAKRVNWSFSSLTSGLLPFPVIDDVDVAKTSKPKSGTLQKTILQSLFDVQPNIVL